MRAAKDALRAQVRRKLAAMTPREKDVQSEAVAAKLLSSPQYRSSRRVSVYVNLDDEVRTGTIIKDIFQSGKTCFVPRYFSDGSGRMDMVLLQSEEQLEHLPLTKWGVRQPPDSQHLDDALLTGGLDLILVPGVAYTAGGARLGRGKGFYDAYLARCRAARSATAPFAAGLAFTHQVVEYVPTDPLDQLVDAIFHPE